MCVGHPARREGPVMVQGGADDVSAGAPAATSKVPAPPAVGSIRCDACAGKGAGDWRRGKDCCSTQVVLSDDERSRKHVAVLREGDVLENRRRPDRIASAIPAHGEVLERVGEGAGFFPDTRLK